MPPRVQNIEGRHRHAQTVYQSPWCKGEPLRKVVEFALQDLSYQTTNLIINLDKDDWILDDPNATLLSVGVGQ